MNTHKFYIKGTKCQSCKIIIEEELSTMKSVSEVNVDLNSKSISIAMLDNDNQENFIDEANRRLKDHGYVIDITQENTKSNKWRDLIFGALISILFIIGFQQLQNLGLDSRIGSPAQSLLAPFVIGLIASVSTCLAVVGGLVLTLSSHYAKSEGTWRSQLSFHIGRLISFAILGGVLGAVGSIFQFSIYSHAVVAIIVSTFMLFNGASLIDGFNIAPKFSFSGVFLKMAMQYSKLTSNTLIPFIVGFITFFLPCGFTQSMQLFALQTGSFQQSSLIMLSFALGTLPTLILISYTSLTFSRSKYAPIFFNAAACVIIFLAIEGIYNALVILNLI